MHVYHSRTNMYKVTIDQTENKEKIKKWQVLKIKNDKSAKNFFSNANWATKIFLGVKGCLISHIAKDRLK